MANNGSGKLNGIGKRITRTPYSGFKTAVMGRTGFPQLLERAGEAGVEYTFTREVADNPLWNPALTGGLNAVPNGLAVDVVSNGTDKYYCITYNQAPYIGVYRQINSTGSLIQLTLPETINVGIPSVRFNAQGTSLALGTFNQGSIPYNLKIWNISGSTLTKITGYTDTTATITKVSWAPDGNRIASIGNEGFVVWNRSGDTFTKLTPIAATSINDWVEWNHDGTSIAYGGLISPYVIVYNVSGDTFTKITTGSNSQFSSTLPPGRARNGAWSPDGSVLAIAHAGNPYISFYNRSGDVFTKVANPSPLPQSTPYAIRWNPDGTSIALVDPAGVSVPFLIYNKSGDTYTRFTPTDTTATSQSGVNNTASQAAWDTDGTKVFVAIFGWPYIQGYTRSGNDFTPSAPGYKFVYYDGGLPRTHQQYSPDGDYLALAGIQSATLNMYKRNTTTGEITRLTTNIPTGSNTYDIDWNHDGSSIAIQTLSSPWIKVWNRSGDTFTEVAGTQFANAFTSGNFGYKTAWNHDGSSLLVMANATPYVVVYNRSGDTFTKLSALPASAFIPSSSGDVKWSPDGTSFVILSTTSPYIECYERSGDTFTKLTTPATNPGWGRGRIAWSPDGTKVLIPALNNIYVYNKTAGALTFSNTIAASGISYTYGCKFNLAGDKFAIADNRTGGAIKIYDFNSNGTATLKTTIVATHAYGSVDINTDFIWDN